MFWRQIRPQALWRVQTDIQVTNERVIGIAGDNPRRVDEGIVSVTFHLALDLILERNLVTARIYAGLSNTGFGDPVNATEVIASWGTFAGTAFPGGKLRGQQAQNANAVRARAWPCAFPTWLMLQYSTAATGVGDNICAFTIYATMAGPELFGVS